MFNGWFTIRLLIGNIDNYENMPRQQLENILTTLLASMPKSASSLQSIQLRMSKDQKKQAPKPFSKPKKRTPILFDLDELTK